MAQGRNPITKHGRDHRPPKTNGPTDPGGHDPIPGLPTGLTGGPGLNDTILNLAPDIFWKLNEGTGNIAHDSSGNGWDAAVQTGFVAPTWGQTAGPPGATSAKFQFATQAAVSNGSFPTLTGNFSAVIWVNRPVWGGGGVVPGKDLIGQGNFGGQGTGHTGWSLAIEPSNAGIHGFNIAIGNTGGAPASVESNAAIVDGTWYVVGLTRASGVWRMYVNGLLQASTYTEGTYSPATSQAIWLGIPPNGTAAANDCLMSYAMVWGSRALSGGEMLSLPTIAATGGLPTVGQVPTADGSGNVTYQTITESLISTSDVTTDDVTSSKHGFAPKSPADATKFLNGATTPAYAQVKDSDLSLSNIGTNDATTSRHGFLPILSNVSTQFLNGVGSWATPTGGGGATFSAVKATISASASIGNNAWTSVLWDTEEFDTDAYHSTSSNTNRLTIPTGFGGKFLLIANGDFSSASGTGIRGMQITKNTVTANTNVVLQASNAGYLSITNNLHAVTILALADADWINMNVYQNSGGALNFGSIVSDCAFILEKIN